MKALSLVLLMSFSTQLLAANKWDSVAVIHRPQKVLIQVNEGSSSQRLQDFMNAIQAENYRLLLSEDKSFKIECQRNTFAGSCVMRFTPSEYVNTANRSVIAQIPLGELQIENKLTEEFKINFLNSNGDQLEIKILDGILQVQGSKR